MSECRNPECRDKYSPGIITSGKGGPRAPGVGATMRWGWVNCRACNPKDKDPAFQSYPRSKGEIQERARLADAKAPYVPAPPVPKLQAIKLATPAPAPNASPTANDDRVDRLMDKIEKLTDQVTALLQENRELRAKFESAQISAAVVPTTRSRKRKDLSS